MYAVFRSGGKQYRAAKGDVLRLEKIDAEEGETVSFDEVLLLGEGGDVKVGSPLIDGSSVEAKVLKQGRTRKVNVVKFRRRQNYLRQGTHRQSFTEVEITDIGATAGSGDKAPARKATTKKKASKKPAAEKAATKKKVAKKASKKKVAKKKAAAKDD